MTNQRSTAREYLRYGVVSDTRKAASQLHGSGQLAVPFVGGPDDRGIGFVNIT